MRNWALFCMAMTSFFISCGQAGTGASTTPDDNKLTCIVAGYDSIIYYTGGSSQMRDVHKGNIADSVFMNSMFRTVKEQGFLLALKPGDGGDMLSNFQQIVNLLNEQQVIRRSIDTLDLNEEK